MSRGDQWIPLMEFALKTGVSLSTLRRRIKANKIRFKMVDGRYLINDRELPEEEIDEQPLSASSKENPSALKSKLNKLERDLHKAHTEIAELKMLIALYEEKIPEKAGH